MRIRDIGFVDLHCHLLPNMDDGSDSVGESEEVIEREMADGAVGLAFSPHFYLEDESIDIFCERRAAACEALKPDIPYALWAEVHMHPDLPDCELDKLSLYNKYILLEFPYGKRPIWGDYVLEEILKQRYIPVLAHIERFHYLTEADLRKYKADGCLLQVNSEFVLHDHKTFKKLYKRGLLDILSSDTHGWARPPELLEAYETVEELCGFDAARELMENSKHIFERGKT